MAVISIDDVRQVARLARLRLADADVQRFAAQIDDILKYVQQLQAVSTDAIEPTSHVLSLSNISRPDRLVPSASPDSLLAIAPQRHGQLFKVPKIIE